MIPCDTPSPKTTMDSRFDTALRQHFQDEPEPEDEGFSQGVQAALPVQAVRGRSRWLERAMQAQWVAISLSACGAAALLSLGGGPLSAAHGVAAYTLLGLLVFWSIPSRWSRG
jgi:hypothetical protein